MATPESVTDPLPAQRTGGPCNWPFDMGCCQGLDLAEVPDAVLTMSKTWSAEILWMATGRRFGLCERLVRPCNRGCTPMSTWPAPNLQSGEWFNSCGCNSYSKCSCGPLCQLCLPGPVYEVCEVLIDGAAVDPTTYRVDDHRYLVRTGGEECWPKCQHMDSAIDEPGSFAVRYLRGTPVPEGGAYAAGQLLCETIKACMGDKSCRLPRNVTQVNRAGIQANFLAAGGGKGSVTGLPEVDMWIGLVNPTSAASASTVWSPDTCAKSRVTTAPRVWAQASCAVGAVVTARGAELGVASPRRPGAGTRVTVVAGEPGQVYQFTGQGDYPWTVPSLSYLMSPEPDELRIVPRAAWSGGRHITVGVSGQPAWWDGRQWHAGVAP